uniref:Uncharacterized protein n=1 Tax=Oryza brachyantha TaxID=4533 RepID=J3LY22_ORYBR
MGTWRKALKLFPPPAMEVEIWFGFSRCLPFLSFLSAPSSSFGLRYCFSEEMIHILDSLRSLKAGSEEEDERANEQWAWEHEGRLNPIEIRAFLS